MKRNALTDNSVILACFMTLFSSAAYGQPQVIYQSPSDRPMVVLPPGAKPAGKTPALLEGEVKKSRKLRNRHGVTCFGVSNQASRHILEYVLDSNWALPYADDSYLVVISFQLKSDGTLGHITVVQPSGTADVDDAAIAAISTALPQINSNLRVVRDTEVIVAFSFAPHGELPVIVRAAEADVLCALKTKDSDPERTRDDAESGDEEELELDAWTNWASHVCRDVALDINKILQAPKNKNLYLPLHLNVVMQVEIGSDRILKVKKTLKGSGNQRFDGTVDEGIRMLNQRTGVTAAPKHSDLKAQMTVHLVELPAH